MTQIKNLWNRLRRWIPLLGLAIVALVIAGIILFLYASTPPTPGTFYTLPDPLPAGDPGTIIRSEPITDNLPKGAVAWRVLYLSTDLNDKPIAVSGVVIAPDGESKSPRPVIAWAQGTQGIFPECGTSHMNNPFKFISGVDLMVSEGFVIAATDYPGHGTPGIHPYLVGPVEAHSVLDSVRTASQLNVSAGDRYAIWGGFSRRTCNFMGSAVSVYLRA